MNISKSTNTLTLTSVVSAGYTYLHVITQVTTTAETNIHEVFTSSSSSKVLPNDGYYKVIEIKLPNTPGNYYYAVNEVIYDPNDVEVTIAELLVLDAEANGITRTDTNVFSMYELNTYYVNLLKTKFQKDICGCECALTMSDRLVIDPITMGVTLINKLNTNLMYYESQRIVEKLSQCTTTVTSLSCNCNG